MNKMLYNGELLVVVMVVMKLFVVCMEICDGGGGGIINVSGQNITLFLTESSELAGKACWDYGKLDYSKLESPYSKLSPTAS